MTSSMREFGKSHQDRLSPEARAACEPALREAAEKAVEMAMLVNEDRLVITMHGDGDRLMAVVALSRSWRLLLDDALRNSVFVVIAMLCLLPAGLSLLMEGLRALVVGLPFAFVAFLSIAAFLHQMWPWMRYGHTPALPRMLNAALSTTAALGEKAIYVAWDAQADGSARVGMIAYTDLVQVECVSKLNGTRLVLIGKELSLEVEGALTVEQIGRLLGVLKMRCNGIRIVMQGLEP